MVQFVEKRDDHLIFSIVALVIFLFFMIFMFGGEDGLVRLMQLKKLKTSLAAQNRALLFENLTYRQEQKKLYTLPVIEHRVRKTLGWVYPNEKVFLTNAYPSSSGGTK